LARQPGLPSPGLLRWGKSLYWGGWAPQFTDADLAQWPTEVADYLRGIYTTVEEEIGVSPKADYINGPLCDALKNHIMALLPE
jgi:hypothetical protein